MVDLEASVPPNEKFTARHLASEWIDILSDSGWADEKNFDKMNLAYPVNEGWLFSKDRHHVKVFASYDKDDDGSYTFGDRIMIPWACVKKMYKI